MFCIDPMCRAKCADIKRYNCKHTKVKAQSRHELNFHNIISLLPNNCMICMFLYSYLQGEYELTGLMTELHTGLLMAPFYCSALFAQYSGGNENKGWKILSGGLTDPATSELLPKASKARGSGIANSICNEYLLNPSLTNTYCVGASASGPSASLQMLVLVHSLAKSPNAISSVLSVQVQVEGENGETGENVAKATSALGVCCIESARADTYKRGPTVLQTTEFQEEVQSLPLGQGVTAVHTGLGESGLNCTTVEMTMKLERRRQEQQHQEQEQVQRRELSPDAAIPSEPWIGNDGTTDYNLLSQLEAKVLAVLSEKPGALLGTIHTAMHLLTRQDTQSLLDLMVQRSLLKCKVSSSRSVRLLNPFSSFACSPVTKKAPELNSVHDIAAASETAGVSYFVNI